jgi:hypothetical protein
MLLGTEKRVINNATLTARRQGNWTQLDQQVAQAKVLIRQMRRTVEDIEDARIIERARLANGNNPRIPWVQVKRELQLD